jgi:hypothetical protein
MKVKKVQIGIIKRFNLNLVKWRTGLLSVREARLIAHDMDKKNIHKILMGTWDLVGNCHKTILWEGKEKL